jgi:hypothetical protein
LTPKERLDEGYPMPINKFGQVDFVSGKSDPHVDQIIHDRGMHYCADTDVPSISKTSFESLGSGESNNRTWSGNSHGMRNEVVISMESESVSREKGGKLEKQTRMCLLKRK